MLTDPVRLELAHRISVQVAPAFRVLKGKSGSDSLLSKEYKGWHQRI